MRLGAFEINEPLPGLREPHALASLRPWIDIGNVGSMVLSRLEEHYKIRELGKLAKPGTFFDFTRYRPNIYIKDGVRQLSVPNATITCTQREAGNDFIFLHLLEPHMFGELYSDSILRLLQKFNARRFFLIGSMYDMVPHTRPLLVTGGAGVKNISDELQRAGIQSSSYQGPTTITYLISQKAAELGIDTMSLIVHLPQYTPVEEDHTGVVRLIEVLSYLYDVTLDNKDVEKAEIQRKEIDQAVSRDPKLKAFVAHLEGFYEERVKKKEEETHRLSPEVEGFLKEIEKRFRQS